jgi:CheY-like chemotaxis protein
MLERVFELFVQTDRPIERSQGGLGIGLTLVRRLTELHGGRVSAHSEGPGLGTEFVVRLPCRGAPAPPSVEETPVGSREVGRRVLVVDDNVDAAESLATVLRMWDYEVWTAFDGPEALQAAASCRPDVILLDIGLPGLDGYEVARRLRANPTAGRPLVAALTGYGQEEDRRRSREAGFDLHLVKPVDPDELLRLLAALPV